jgi:hypothetical protein
MESVTADLTKIKESKFAFIINNAAYVIAAILFLMGFWAILGLVFVDTSASISILPLVFIGIFSALIYKNRKGGLYIINSVLAVFLSALEYFWLYKFSTHATVDVPSIFYLPFILVASAAGSILITRLQIFFNNREFTINIQILRLIVSGVVVAVGGCLVILLLFLSNGVGTVLHFIFGGGVAELMIIFLLGLASICAIYAILRAIAVKYKKTAIALAIILFFIGLIVALMFMSSFVISGPM